MKVFGISVAWIVIALVAFYIGSKNPSLIAKVPGLNKL